MIGTKGCNGKQLAVVTLVTMTMVDREVTGTGAPELQMKTIHTTTMILTLRVAIIIIGTKMKNDIQMKSIKRKGDKRAKKTLSILHLRIGTRNRVLILIAM